MRDWNRDNQVDGKDYALFHNVIISDDDSDQGPQSNPGCGCFFWACAVLLVMWVLIWLFVK